MNAPLLPGRIEHWPLARLRPYARNAKTHDADQVAKIAASMAEFGWTVPCLVAADGELIAGHGRVLAAAQLGLTEAPVIVLGHLSEAQRRAYRIADNKLTELGGWDEALLLEELRGLLAEDLDLGLIGIPEDELDALGFDDCLAWARRVAADPEGSLTAAAEPALRRMADGLAHRARALRLLGNGVHPLAAAHAWRSLAAAHGLGPVDLAANAPGPPPGADGFP